MNPKIFLLPVLMLLCVNAFSQSMFSELTFEKALQKAKDENKKVFVFATTIWAGPVRYMKQNTFTETSVIDLFSKKYISIEIDIEDEANAAFVKQHTIENIPTLLFFDSAGKTLGKIQGSKSAEDLIAAQSGF